MYCGGKEIKHFCVRAYAPIKYFYRCPSDVPNDDRRWIETVKDKKILNFSGGEKSTLDAVDGQKILNYTNGINEKNTTGCSTTKRFLSDKECEVQRALGLL